MNLQRARVLMQSTDLGRRLRYGPLQLPAGHSRGCADRPKIIEQKPGCPVYTRDLGIDPAAASCPEKGFKAAENDDLDA